MVGMIGCLGSAAVIKKLGGYSNTKVSTIVAGPRYMVLRQPVRTSSLRHRVFFPQIHGILSWVGIMCSMGGLYAIYKNKENRGAQHFQTTHAMAGLACMLSCVGLGLVGGVVLHPDFGIDKGNKTIRYVDAKRSVSREAMLF